MEVLGQEDSQWESEAGRIASLATQWLVPSQERAEAVSLVTITPILGGSAASPVQRQTSEVLSAAKLAVSLTPAGRGGFVIHNVNFRYSRQKAGPIAEEIKASKFLREGPSYLEKTFPILEISTLGEGTIGSSVAFVNLLLRYDGHNILSAVTQESAVHGYAGGLLGDEAEISFSVVEASGPEEPVTKAQLNFLVIQNPVGPGFHRVVGTIFVMGDGTVSFGDCTPTQGEEMTSVKRAKVPGFEIGFK